MGNSLDLSVYLNDPLFVFALASEEAEQFIQYNPLIVGVGKVNAAIGLSKYLHQHRPGIIINLGSAGSSRFARGEVVCCNRFIQRDMDVRGLGFQLYETPFSDHGPLLEYGLSIEALPQGICGTGDSFEMQHLTEDYDVVDMEAYPLAYIAKQENIPFLCLKYITDGADETAGADWTEEVHKAAMVFRKLFGVATVTPQ
ncbi:MAG: nucleosidase [Sphingobacteriales bacterium SCN 48-20]|uniref:5'-methylthioadenosine/S-adenosylhomocysteine nucleosidase family protein n=1 Tax=Terrimonas ferruginea TaxID=249 RepID=UPI00086F89AF|nr:hypothetical protein [Terrimonas ferruginea]MBN8784045.1 hypothetical protein [Terrimonas ferruginea]ODT95653.1 MAG: nucleosidase [Sphingobacteriales bacterium SCN 48-20]OJW41800.1 MAG: nucleosidase [Sphingobacteriales bacterium 48-107]